MMFKTRNFGHTLKVQEKVYCGCNEMMDSARDNSGSTEAVISTDDKDFIETPVSSENGTHDDQTGADAQAAKMSKNQLKKQRKREKWIAIKHEKRADEKRKRKQRLAERREAGEDIGPTRKSLKTNTMKNSSCRIRVVLDLSFDSYMADKDITSLIRQLQHSYSTNRRAENPMQLYLCGLHGKTKERLDGIGDYKGWDVYRESRNYEEMFPVSSIVYLTSDSPNMLESLSDDKVYVIGGLVDHNQQKGLCHQLAEEKGLAHAQLPISDFLEMSTRKVLAVNHVFSILLRFSESHDWKQAFLSEVPQRKGFQTKDATGDSGVLKEAEPGQQSSLKETENQAQSEACSNTITTPCSVSTSKSPTESEKTQISDEKRSLPSSDTGSKQCAAETKVDEGVDSKS